MGDVKMFPGVQPLEEATSEKVLEQIKELNPKQIVVVCTLEDDRLMVVGNTSVAMGVYCLEVGKQVLINEQD